MHIVLLRDPDAEYLEFIKDRLPNASVDFCPVLETRYAEDINIDRVSQDDSVIITSKRAVDALERTKALSQLSKRYFYAIGKSTFNYLHERMPEDITGVYLRSLTSADMSASKQLAQMIIHNHTKERSYTYFCAAGRRDELPQALRDAGIQCTETVVYETVARAALQLPLESDDDTILVFYSPSGVDACWSQVADNLKLLKFVCIGSTTATHLLSKADGLKLVIAKSPSVEGVCDAITQSLI